MELVNIKMPFSSLSRTTLLVLLGVLCSAMAQAKPLTKVEEVDKTQVDNNKKEEAVDTQFLVQSGVDSAAFAKREVSPYDYLAGDLLDEQRKRSRGAPSRNPYSWMAKSEEKRSRNPYSWMAVAPSAAEDDERTFYVRSQGPPPKRRGRVDGVVAAPLNWAENSAKRGAGVRNPYSWMNFV